MQRNTIVQFNRIHPDAVAPTYGTPLSAGFDLAIVEELTLCEGESRNVGTGLVIQAPVDHMLLIAPRSSTWKKWGITLGNTVGILDEDYCGPEDECRLYVHYPSVEQHNAWVTIPAGTRIAQGVFVPITRAVFRLAEGPLAKTRGGWGSTGD